MTKRVCFCQQKCLRGGCRGPPRKCKKLLLIMQRQNFSFWGLSPLPGPLIHPTNGAQSAQRSCRSVGRPRSNFCLTLTTRYAGGVRDRLRRTHMQHIANNRRGDVTSTSAPVSLIHHQVTCIDTTKLRRSLSHASQQSSQHDVATSRMHSVSAGLSELSCKAQQASKQGQPTATRRCLE